MKNRWPFTQVLRWDRDSTHEVGHHTRPVLQREKIVRELGSQAEWEVRQAEWEEAQQNGMTIRELGRMGGKSPAEWGG